LQLKSAKLDSKEKGKEKDKERTGKKQKDKDRREAQDDEAARLRREAKGHVAECWVT
jgi:hypothetical protein